MSAEYLAVDLGAESGRVVLGRFDGGRVSLEEIHRFPNMPVRLPDGLHWDVLRMLSEIKDGLGEGVRTLNAAFVLTLVAEVMDDATEELDALQEIVDAYVLVRAVGV